eukprot:jgi/Botrbrau1/6795/Bobra.0057s0027.1
MKNCDYIHNIASAAKEARQTVMSLVASPNVPLEELFTKASNCPVKAVPRIALKETTLNGLLSKPALPGKTVFFFVSPVAAEKYKNLYFTFGSGAEYRSCPFLPFWKSLMTDLQTNLQKN